MTRPARLEKTELLQDALRAVRGNTLDIMDKTAQLLANPVPSEAKERAQAIDKEAKTILGEIDAMIAAEAPAATGRVPA